MSLSKHSYSNPNILFTLYFLMFAAGGIYFTYFLIFLRQSGLTSAQIGIINMSAGVVAFVASTLWGYLSDRTGKAHLLLAFAIAANGAISLLYPLARAFPAFLAIACVFAIFNAAIMTLMDSLALDLLGERRHEYGKYRLGGTFGYISTTLTIGFLFERIGLRWMFPIYFLIMLLYALLAMRLPDSRAGASRSSLPSLKTLGVLLRQPGWGVFLITTFLIWLASSGAISFLGIKLKGMGASDSLVGIVASAAAIFEIPFMLYSGQIMRKLGITRTLWFALIGYIARVSLYTIIPTPEWAIAVNGLNGVSYVLYWNAALQFNNQNAPENLKATAQGILVSTMNLASVASALLTGSLYDTLGANPVYTLLAGICVLAFILFTLGNRSLLFPPKPESQTFPQTDRL